MRSEQGQLKYSNSVIALMPQTSPAASANYQYDKHHLVPFGEFVPPLFQWFVRMMHIPLGEFTRGDVAQPSLAFKGERIAPNICYEDLFGEELARSFANPDTAPTLMVNLSNIAWFGDTVAIDQHLHISRMRALELGRPMLRATNTGATAIIDAQGRITHRLPSAVQGALTAEVYGMHGPVTPYAKWVSKFGLWPLVGIALLTLLIVGGMAYASRHGKRRFGP
jgi:apolipoprotein N-acyltransferase